MDELKDASEIKKISEDNFKIHEKNKKELEEQEQLLAYQFCVSDIDTAAFHGRTQAECNPLAEKYEKLLKEKGYKLSMDKNRSHGAYNMNMYKRDVLHVSWDNSEAEAEAESKSKQNPFSFLSSLFRVQF